MGRVRVGAVLFAIAVGGCGGSDAVSLRAASVHDGPVKLPTISTSTPTLLPVSANSQQLNCPFHDRLGGQSGGVGASFELR
jgi:hypothetical protein